MATLQTRRRISFCLRLAFISACVSLLPGGCLTSNSGGGTGIGGSTQRSVRLSAATYSGTEGGSVDVVVKREGRRAGTVRVDYDAAGVTADSGADFSAASGTLVWGPGDVTDKVVTVSLATDGLIEGDETFAFTLFFPGGAVLGNPETAVVTIRDSDAPPAGVLQFSSETYFVNEDVPGGLAVITVTRTGGSLGAVGVTYATSNGTATAPADYTATGGALAWADGDAAGKTFTIPIVNDALVEGNETVNLTLSSPTGGAVLGSANPAVLTLIDDDAPGVLQVTSLSFSVFENDGSGTGALTVSRTGGVGGVVTVDYVTSDGSAVEGQDYLFTTGTLTWLDGDSTDKTILVPIVDDGLPEATETVIVTLSNPGGGATLGAITTATLNILDND